MLHGKGKSSSFIDYSVGPNSAAMTLDYPVDDGQTHASPWELISTMHSLENTKKIIRISPIQASTIVSDKTDMSIIFSPASYFHNCMLFSAHEFECIERRLMNTCLSKARSAWHSGRCPIRTSTFRSPSCLRTSSSTSLASAATFTARFESGCLLRRENWRRSSTNSPVRLTLSMTVFRRSWALVGI